MQVSEHVHVDDSSTGLALTLIRTFGTGALPMVDEQVTACADHPELHRRWSEVRKTLATLVGANAHMEAALDLLDEAGEHSIPPTLVQAIALLGLCEGGQQRTEEHATVSTCGSAYFDGRAQHHLDIAQRTADDAAKAKHLDVASHYATMREQIDGSRRSPPS